MSENYKPSEKACINCKYLLWMIGIGQGLKCKNEKNKDEKDNFFEIPNRFYSCENFEVKKYLQNS